MLKILFIAYKYEYRKPEFGLSFEYCNFYDVLVKMNNRENEVIYFPIDEITKRIGYDKMNQKLLEIVEEEKPGLCFFVLLQGFLEKEVVRKISQKDKVITFNWFTDDYWTFDNFSKYWVSSFNWVATTDFEALPKYKKIGYKNVIKTQYGCNHFLFKPLNLPKIYDVTFVGQPHGNRKQIVKKLEKADIKSRVFW